MIKFRWNKEINNIFFSGYKISVEEENKYFRYVPTSAIVRRFKWPLHKNKCIFSLCIILYSTDRYTKV